MEFPRTRTKIGALNLTPMIDIFFILIVFFMLTTTFMKVESMELMLPSMSGKATESKDVVRLFIRGGGEMTLGSRRVDAEELKESFIRMFKRDPGTRVMLLTSDQVTLQELVNIMDMAYIAGGKSLFVRKWERG